MIPSTMTPGLIRAHHHPSTALHHSAEAHPLAAEQPAAGDKKTQDMETRIIEVKVRLIGQRNQHELHWRFS